MERILDRYYPLWRMAGSLLVGLLLIEQTLAQTSTDLATPRWGSESLYHMESGLRGAASCASSGCHGGPRPGVAMEESMRGSEYALWLEKDPHARSWKTMSSAKSVAILTKLGIMQDGSIRNTAAYKNCLACHNTDRRLGSDHITPVFAEGVGCEACHGPSETWYSRHYQGTGSKKNAVESLGLTDSKPLLSRAKICTTCHVGSSDRDMNHDIIAAGHPALYFDMAVYHEAYPKHWREHSIQSPELRPKLWLAGKIAMADAELELIEARASKRLPVSVWPELSHYQCNSCHVALNGIPKVESKTDKASRIGNAPVRNWNLSGTELLASTGYGPNEVLDRDIGRLRKLLEISSPEPDQAAVVAGSLRVELLSTVSVRNKPMLRSWSGKQQAETSLRLLETAKQQNTWESASSAYVAMWACRTSKRSNQLDSAMRTMREALLFPDQLQTPDFPKNPMSSRSPSLEQWNGAFQLAWLALKSDESK